MNSKCRNARSRFGPMLDGDLNPAAVRRVEAVVPAAHLQQFRDGKRLPDVAVPAGNGGRLEHRVVHRLLGSLDRRLEQRRQTVAAQDAAGLGW